jgi:transcriptional regulator with XRE-family HTH domain
MKFSLALPHEICIELGKRTRARRLMLNFSLEELAQRTGLSPVTLSHLEHTGKCTLETFIRVLEVFNATHDLETILSTPLHSVEEMKTKHALSTRKRAYRKRLIEKP